MTTLTPPPPTTEEVEIVSRYEAKFGMLAPPLDYGQAPIRWDAMIELAQAALIADRPIQWPAILKPIPVGANS